VSAMSCSDVLELIEPIAAGDIRADEAVRAHLQSCVTCAAALASAQRLEIALKGMEIPPAPAAFTPMVVQRIRRDRWQSEQYVDRLFNVAMVAAVLLMAGGVLAMLNLEAVMGIAASAWGLLRGGMRSTVQDAAPTVATYVAAAGLLASALGMWWWAERRLMV
jgi:anti-sigma factor RsiW